MPSIPVATPARNTNSSVEAIRGFPMDGLLLTIGDQIHENGILVGCTCHQPGLTIIHESGGKGFPQGRDPPPPRPVVPACRLPGPPLLPPHHLHPPQQPRRTRSPPAPPPAHSVEEPRT